MKPHLLLKYLVSAGAISFLLLQCVSAPPKNFLSEPNRFHRPKRLMVLVFDQLRPDLIERYKLPNFTRLKSRAITFNHAMVGHLASATVVSHPVLSTGLFPRNLPWGDLLWKDEKNLLKHGKHVFNSMDLTLSQYQELLSYTATTSLLPRIQKEIPLPLPTPTPAVTYDEKVAAHTYVIGQKNYAVYGFGSPLQSGSVITLGSKIKEPPLSGWRAPVGLNLPVPFLEPFKNRFFLDSSSTYGSETTFYPLDGNRFFRGFDPSHIGGDQWVADGITTVMNLDRNWKAIFATFGSIDKILHMLGEHESPTEEKWALEKNITLKVTLEEADRSLGMVLDELVKKELFDDTAILITADHGGQANSPYLGSGTGLFLPKEGEPLEVATQKSPDLLKEDFKSGEILAGVHDSAIRLWVKTPTRLNLRKWLLKLSQLPGVFEIYSLQKTGSRAHYLKGYGGTNVSPEDELWAKTHHLALLDTMAAPGAADIVLLLKNGYGYGLKGEHGGAQPQVQHIPFILYSPNLDSGASGVVSDAIVRLVDANPILSKIMGLSLPPALDGSSHAIEKYLK